MKEKVGGVIYFFLINVYSLKKSNVLVNLVSFLLEKIFRVGSHNQNKKGKYLILVNCS